MPRSNDKPKRERRPEDRHLSAKFIDLLNNKPKRERRPEDRHASAKLIDLLDPETAERLRAMGTPKKTTKRSKRRGRRGNR